MCTFEDISVCVCVCLFALLSSQLLTRLLVRLPDLDYRRQKQQRHHSGGPT